jgi:hypothetical protein
VTASAALNRMVLLTPASTPSVVQSLCEQALRVGDARPDLVCGLTHRLVAVLRLVLQLARGSDAGDGSRAWNVARLRDVQPDTDAIDATALTLLASPVAETRRLALRLTRTARAVNEAIVARCATARPRSPAALYLADVIEQAQSTLIRDAARLTGHTSLLSHLVDAPPRRHLWLLADLPNAAAQACWAHRYKHCCASCLV